jgi:hypothetical protein
MTESEETTDAPESGEPEAAPAEGQKKDRKRKQPKLTGEARAERKRQLKAERRARIAAEAQAGAGAEVAAASGDIDARLARIEEAVSKQSELSKELLVKVEALLAEPEEPAE